MTERRFSPGEVEQLLAALARPAFTWRMNRATALFDPAAPNGPSERLRRSARTQYDNALVEMSEVLDQFARGVLHPCQASVAPSQLGDGLVCTTFGRSHRCGRDHAEHTARHRCLCGKSWEVA